MIHSNYSLKSSSFLIIRSYLIFYLVSIFIVNYCLLLIFFFFNFYLFFVPIFLVNVFSSSIYSYHKWNNYVKLIQFFNDFFDFRKNMYYVDFLLFLVCSYYWTFLLHYLKKLHYFFLNFLKNFLNNVLFHKQL